MDLFDAAYEDQDAVKPLAIRMSPRTLDEYVGQEHLLGPGKLLRRLLESGRLVSVILYGPPGTGKTAFARLVARRTQGRLVPFNAVTSGVPELRKVLEVALEQKKLYQKATILFMDEIHHFNKSQQDALLPHLEQGTILLVGATTQNPFFALNRALLSRSRVCELRPLEEHHLQAILDRALTDPERGLGATKVDLTSEARAHLIQASNGDARTLLNALEVGVLTTPPDAEGVVRFDVGVAQDSVQKKAVVYDRNGDAHYDTISAFIKSVRGSDPDAALYWLARMLEGGEDVRFLARRLVILASEDVGNADPHGLPLAVAAAHACELVGLPECQLTLAQAVTYLACAPKSNAATIGIGEARRDVREGRLLPVPVHLRDSHYPGAKRFGHGEGYQYAHDHEGGVAAQDYLGVQREYYRPVDRGFEQKLAKRLEAIRARLRSK